MKKIKSVYENCSKQIRRVFRGHDFCCDRTRHKTSLDAILSLAQVVDKQLKETPVVEEKLSHTLLLIADRLYMDPKHIFLTVYDTRLKSVTPYSQLFLDRIKDVKIEWELTH